MSEMTHLIPELDRKGLREFGLVTGGIVVVLFGLVLPWIFTFSFPTWPWVVGGILGGWALVAPQTLRSPYRAWMRLGLLLNRVTTPIIMGIAFFLIVTPTGALMRIFRKKPLALDCDTSASTYRVQSQEAPKRNMEKPF